MIMKSNELMVGDWVAEAIQPSNKWQFKVEDFVNLDDNDCIPIELSEEILNANDWTHEHRCRLDIYYLTKQIAPRVGRKTGVRTQKAQFYKASDGRVMTKYHIHGIDRNYEGSIHYVHELQNIFKMCGLLELADSFKIQ